MYWKLSFDTLLNTCNRQEALERASERTTWYDNSTKLNYSNDVDINDTSLNNVESSSSLI